MEWRTRRTRSGEGRQLREIRLRALADAATGFASTLGAGSARPTDSWEQAATSRASGADAVTFVAETDAHWIGLVGAFRTAERPEVVELVSKWVEPADCEAVRGKSGFEDLVVAGRSSSRARSPRCFCVPGAPYAHEPVLVGRRPPLHGGLLIGGSGGGRVAAG